MDFVQIAVIPVFMAGSAQDLPGGAERAQWKPLHKGKVAVVCGPFAESMWCHAEAVLPGPRSEVHALLADVESIAGLFPRMRSMTQLNDDVMHQIIDYPFPYDDRDIVAHFSWQHTDDADALTWVSVAEPTVPTVGVRLDGAAGRFELRDGQHANTTVLAYTWRGELGPGLPDWVRPYAWRAQADEVVEGLTRGLAPASSPD